MAELRDISLPPNFFDFAEMKEIDRVSEKFMLQLYNDIESLHDDIFILTASEEGTARREKILGITPKDTDSLDARRARVLMQWYEKTPYTTRVIERKIAVLCGEGNYNFEYDAENMVLTVEMSGVEWDVIDSVRDSLEKMVRLMVILDVKKIFFSTASAITYAGFKHVGLIEYAVPIDLTEEEE